MSSARKWMVAFTAFTTLSSAACPAPSLTADQFAQTMFDYLVIGSGAGGLPLAARLSEDPTISVGLIEAGQFFDNDPLIDTPAFMGRATGNASYDWMFQTVPQTEASDRVIQETTGKLLGGGTGLNYLGWDRASASEYDAWATLVNSSAWNFDSLLPYFRKSEHILLGKVDAYPGITKEQVEAAEAEFKIVNGFDGPIQASYNNIYGDIALPLATTWNNLGMPTNLNSYGGNTSGVRNDRLSIGNGVRSYATSAYYCPTAARTNFHVLTSAQVTGIALSNDTQIGLYNATGVFFSSGSVTYTAKAAKEVILSAGSFQTPQLLELSGIGDSAILSQHGIRTLIDLPGVGNNLQGHIFTVGQWAVNENITTFDKIRINQTFLAEQTELYEKNRTGYLAAGDSLESFIGTKSPIFNSSDVQDLVADLTAVQADPSLSPLQRAQYALQSQWLQDGSVPQAEIVGKSEGFINPANDTSYFCQIAGLMHPLSRGSVHINSTDPLVPPFIDPRYLSYKYDLRALSIFTKIMTMVADQKPVSDLWSSREFPALNVTTDAQYEEYVRSIIISGAHPIGTAAMASRELNGVVDETLTVYGTSNLRVVDASIMPLQIGAHLQATVYAIAEKAADIIKQSA